MKVRFTRPTIGSMIVLQHLTLTDLSDIRDGRNDLFAVESGAMPDACVLETSIVILESMQAFPLMRDSYIVYGVIEAKRMIGFATIQDLTQGVCAFGFHLAAAYRRRGHGTSVVRQLVDAATIHGYHAIECGVENDNAASTAVLSKAGFRANGRYVDTRDSNDQPVRLMTYRLNLQVSNSCL